MRRAEQTLESIQSDFDRIALLDNEIWNHNAHYHRFLINQLPGSCRNVLEIGCGTGEFSRLLARRAEKVLALDLSPQMICLARERSKLYPNIDFIEGDIMTYQLPNDHFDCVASLTTLHHLPMTGILIKIKQALGRGGTFIGLDLYQRSTLADLFLDVAA